MQAALLSWALLFSASAHQLFQPGGAPRATRPEPVAHSSFAPGATATWARIPPASPRFGRTTEPPQSGLSATCLSYFALGSAFGGGIHAALALRGRRAEREAVVFAAAVGGCLGAWISGEVPAALAVSGLCAMIALRAVRRDSTAHFQSPLDAPPAVRDIQSALCAAGASAVIMGATVISPPPALAATDSAAIGSCLLQNCQRPLARCVSDPICAANLLCIQTCTGKPDESTCQIKCGDEFANPVTERFTACAVSQKKCVPQRQDDGSWPVPTEAALVESFSPKMFTGDWYISAGLNRAFDTFDCQLHKFKSPADNKFVGDLQWRIKNPLIDKEFVTRTTTQEFYQDPKVPGILYNHDNEFLHYQDDWYILGAREDAYMVVYYRGTNDAWDGYGGAVVYSRSPKFPKEYKKEIDESLQKIGRSLKDFQETNNTCEAKPNKIDDLVYVESRVASGITAAEGSFVSEITKDINIVAADVVAAEKELVKDAVAVEKEIVKDVVAVEKVLEKDVVKIEDEIIRDEQKFLNFFRRS